MNSLRRENEDLDVMPLCYFGHPGLKQKSVDIDDLTDSIMKLAEKMVSTVKANDGIGLAGPQVGHNINLVVLNIPKSDEDGRIPSFTSPGEMSLIPIMPLILVNPGLSQFSDQQIPYVEGCLSIPGITAEVIRPEFVQLDAKLLNGQKISYRCGGILARCLQHECDHLNGILFLDLLTPEVRKSLDSQLQELKKSLKSEKFHKLW